MFSCVYQVPDTVLGVSLELVCIYLLKLNKTHFDHNNIPVNCPLKKGPTWGVLLTWVLLLGLPRAPLKSPSLSLSLEKQITEYLSYDGGAEVHLQIARVRRQGSSPRSAMYNVWLWASCLIPLCLSYTSFKAKNIINCPAYFIEL